MQKKIAFSLLSVVLVASSAIACGGAGGEVEPDGETTSGTTTQQQQDLAIGGLNAKGDDCTIDLPDGLKKPGKDDGNGHCCSVWDEKDCVDLPKKDSAFIGRTYSVRAVSR